MNEAREHSGDTVGERGLSSGLRVLVVAASPVVRAGLSAMLAEAGGFEVEQAGELSLSTPGLSRADVLLVADEMLLEEAIPVLAVDAEGSRAVVVLSEDGYAVARLRSLALRGWSVLSPDASPDELGAAVSAVARGLVVVSASLSEELLELPESREFEEAPEPLTARESEVLGLLAGGLSNKMISRDLRISEHTGKFHLSSLYAKLDAGNRAEAVSRGARYGLISL